MATIEHGATFTSKLRDLASQFLRIRADVERGAPDPVFGFWLLSEVRTRKLQIETADAISTACECGLLSDVPGLDDLVKWHADIAKNDEPLPPGTHCRPLRGALSLFPAIHDKVLVELKPGLFRRQFSAMGHIRGGKLYPILSDPPGSFVEINLRTGSAIVGGRVYKQDADPRVDEETRGPIERLQRMEQLTSSAMLCEWFANRLKAEQAADRGSASGEGWELEQYVTLDQIAALVSRSKRALERYVSKMPPPAVKGVKGRAAEWCWAEVRPWVNDTFGRKLPEKLPRTHLRNQRT